MFGVRLHTEDAEAIAIIRWIVEAIGSHVDGEEKNPVVSAEKIRQILNRMNMTHLLARAQRACHNNFMKKYLDFHYQKKIHYGSQKNVLMVRVSSDFFTENPLGMSFDFPLPPDVTEPEKVYLMMIEGGFLPQGFKEVREHLHEGEVKIENDQSQFSRGEIQRAKITAIRSKPHKQQSRAKGKNPPVNAPDSKVDHDIDDLLNRIRKTKAGGIPYRVLEKRSGLNGDLDDWLDALEDSNLTIIVPGKSRLKDVYVATEFFEDD